jgi:chitinase
MKTEISVAAATAIRCALADLIGAWQNWDQDGRPDSSHDWDSHELTITELAREFDLQGMVPEELK